MKTKFKGHQDLLEYLFDNIIFDLQSNLKFSKQFNELTRLNR